MIKIRPPRAYKVAGVQVLNSQRQPLRLTPRPRPTKRPKKIRRLKNYKTVWYNPNRGLQIVPPEERRERFTYA